MRVAYRAVENRRASRGVEAVLEHRGIPSSAYDIKVTEPIRFMQTLRDGHRPTMGGIQILTKEEPLVTPVVPLRIVPG